MTQLYGDCLVHNNEPKQKHVNQINEVDTIKTLLAKFFGGVVCYLSLVELVDGVVADEAEDDPERDPKPEREVLLK